MSKKIKLILILGIILRVLFSAITYHSDVVPFPFAGKVIFSGNVINFYDYLWSLPEGSQELSVYPRNLFNYPPAPYFFLGGISLITTSPFGTFVDDFIYNLRDVLGDIRLNFLLVLLKLPYLPFDMGVAFLIMKFFSKEREKLLAFGFWVFNPVNLYATYMIGMYEVIPTFFVVASLYFVSRNARKLSTASFLLGLGASFKIFPLIFLAPLASVSSSWKERAKIFLLGIGVYLLTILPFLASSGFRRTSLVAGQTTKSLYLQFPISGGEAIFPALALLIFFYLIFLFKKINPDSLWQRCFILLILFFALTHYHPQWFVWITPFLILDLIKSKFTHWPVTFLSLLSFFGLVTLFDPGLSIGLFSAVSPSLYDSSGIWNLLGLNIDINYARSVLQTIFVGCGMYWIYYYLNSPIKKWSEE